MALKHSDNAWGWLDIAHEKSIIAQQRCLAGIKSNSGSYTNALGKFYYDKMILKINKHKKGPY